MRAFDPALWLVDATLAFAVRVGFIKEHKSRLIDRQLLEHEPMRTSGRHILRTSAPGLLAGRSLALTLLLTSP